jgi:hypothetical protein
LENRKCTRWRHLGLAILKSPTSPIFSKMYSIFKIGSKLQKLQNFNTTS